MIVDGLRVFALVAAIAGLVAVVQALERHAAGTGAALDVLRDLGVARRGRVAALLLAVTPAVLGGALGALAFAWLWSPFMPIGLARRAEPDHGFSFDGRVLGVGVLVLLVAVVLVAVLVAWRVAARAPTRAITRSRGAGLDARSPAGGRDRSPTRDHARAGTQSRAGPVGDGRDRGGRRRRDRGERLRQRTAPTGRRAWTLRRAVGRHRVSRTQRIGARPTPGGSPRSRRSVQSAIVHAQLDGLLDGRADGNGFALARTRDAIRAVVRSGHAPSAPGEIAVGLDTAHRLGLTSW